MIDSNTEMLSQSGEATLLRKPAGRMGIPEATVKVLLALALAAAYLPPLLRSLWIDEAGMFWMARGGPLAAIHKASNWPGQSILFSAITSLFCFEGSPFRDILLRLPALLGAAAACYILYRFANDAIGPGAGRIAAIVFAFTPTIVVLATAARPYSCAMAAAAASCWTLYRWTQFRERRWLSAYVVSLALVFYFHYMFSLILVAHAALLAWEFFRERRFTRAGELIMAYGAVIVLVLPLVPHLLLLFRESHTLSYTPRPTSIDLAQLLLHPVFGAVLLLTGIVAHTMYPDLAEERGAWRPGLVIMMVVWWCAGPLIAFVVANVTSAEIFVLRYISYSALGLVLLLTSVGYSIFGPKVGFVWILVAALLTSGNPVHAVTHIRTPGVDELRPAMRIIERESAGQASLPPVLVRSDLTESNFQDWQAGNVPQSYLFAGFVAYPMKNTLVPLPYRLTDPVKDHIVQLIDHSLRNESRILFVTNNPSWIPWIGEQFEKAGFTSRWIQPNHYSVGVFERRTIPGQP